MPCLCLAQRALAAAANLARVAADILLLPALPLVAAAGAREVELPTSELRRLSRLSICRRIETACSKFLRDRSMPGDIAGILMNSKQLFVRPTYNIRR